MFDIRTNYRPVSGPERAPKRNLMALLAQKGW